MENFFFGLFQIVPASSLHGAKLKFLLIFVAALFALSWGIKFFKKYFRENKFIKKTLRILPTPLFYFGIFGALLIWFRLENMPFLAMRFWWIVYFAAFGIWLFFAIRKILRIKKRLDRAMFGK